MRTEAFDIRLIERREGVKVGEEAQRLHDITQRCADARQLQFQVGYRLSGLCLNATSDD